MGQDQENAFIVRIAYPVANAQVVAQQQVGPGRTGRVRRRLTGQAALRQRFAPGFPGLAQLTLAHTVAHLHPGPQQAHGDGRLPGSGRAALSRVAQTLALRSKADKPNASMPPMAQIPRHGTLILIGDFLSPVEEMETIIRGYAARGVNGHLLQVLDPVEEDLPFEGRTEFEGVEGEGRLVVSRVEGLRQLYLDKLADQRQTLRHLTRAAGWTFTQHRTDKPAQVPLLTLYELLSTGGG